MLINFLHFFLIIISTLYLCGCATTPKTIYPQVSKYVGSYDYNKYRNIAVLPFIDAPNVPQSGQIVSGLASQIFARSGFQVVERSRLYDILSEQRLLSSGLLSESQQIKIGQMLGVKAVVVGEVGQYTIAQRHTDTTYFPLILSGQTSYVPIQGKQWMESYVSISLRIIDIETGQLIYSGSGQYNQGLTNPPQQLAEFILDSIINGWLHAGTSDDAAGKIYCVKSESAIVGGRIRIDNGQIGSINKIIGPYKSCPSHMPIGVMLTF